MQDISPIPGMVLCTKALQEAISSHLRILIKESWLSVDPCNKSESHMNSCMVHVKYKILFQGVFDNDMQAS